MSHTQVDQVVVGILAKTRGLAGRPANRSRLPSTLRTLAALTVINLAALPVTTARAGSVSKEKEGSGTPPSPSANKNQYNLFNPTPKDLLRPFSSSRPDQTTGPRSVDAGHFYLETGVSYGLNLGATRTDTWTAFQSSRIRVGLTNNVELELIYDGLDNQRTKAGGRTTGTIDGSGATTVRTRFALVGNDTKGFALRHPPGGHPADNQPPHRLRVCAGRRDLRGVLRAAGRLQHDGQRDPGHHPQWQRHDLRVRSDHRPHALPRALPAKKTACRPTWNTTTRW